MTEIPSTRVSLLIRLRDGSQPDAWDDFVRLYAPVVYRFARRKGLQDSDAADVTQEVLHSVVGAIRNYATDGRPERFRSWLFTLAHRRLYDFGVRRRREAAGSGDTGVFQQLHEQPAPDDCDGWEREWQQGLFRWAADQVRARVSDTTWQAFWLTAVDALSGKEAAARLGMTEAAVYVAKSRVMLRLKEAVATMADE